MIRRARPWTAAALAALLTTTLAACGGDEAPGSDPGPAVDGAAAGAADGAADAEDLGDAVGAALGAGGGGTLVFDGEEIPIDSVVCSLSGDEVEVGTVSASGHRVLLSRSSSSGTIGAQVLDEGSRVWTPEDWQAEAATREDRSFTSGPTPYRSDGTERVVRVSFTVDCP